MSLPASRDCPLGNNIAVNGGFCLCSEDDFRFPLFWIWGISCLLFCLSLIPTFELRKQSPWSLTSKQFLERRKLPSLGFLNLSFVQKGNYLLLSWEECCLWRFWCDCYPDHLLRGPRVMSWSHQWPWRMGYAMLPESDEQPLRPLHRPAEQPLL